jgi:signal transduction histidine kinase
MMDRVNLARVLLTGDIVRGPLAGDAAPDSRTLQIVCADPDLARQYLRELERGGSLCEFVLALSATEAQRNLVRSAPLVTLLDESAVPPDDSLRAVVALLCEIAPVVVVASRERQAELDAFISTGWLDFVPRSGEFVPVATGLLERRMRRARWGGAADAYPDRGSLDDFGELLRHEVNNPLTGILGNAELLLARRDHLPPATVERLETIAALAVRLRETVRRLSQTWQERHEQAPSA